MARAETKRTIEITLVLNEQEAIYLKGLLQNSIGNADEPKREYELRAGLFHSLKDALDEARKG